MINLITLKIILVVIAVLIVYIALFGGDVKDDLIITSSGRIQTVQNR